jgi:hypothetical protein
VTDRALGRRGLATGIFRFIIALAFFAVLYLVFNEFVPGFIDGSLSPLGAGRSGELSDLQTYTGQAWVFFPVFMAFALALRLVVRAAFESRGGAR